MRINPIETRVYEGVLAERRLAELGLSLEGLREVVAKGEYARAEATDHDPVTAAGSDAYRYRVRGLRDAYCGRGWTKWVKDGLEMICSDDGRYAVITRGGDLGVGVRDAFPQPNRSVGESTESAVNNGSGMLDPNWFNRGSTAARPTREVYMLLVCRFGDVARSELSLASAVDEDGQIPAWIERILLPDLDLSGPESRLLPQPSDSQSEAIDVPVIRKR